MTRPFLLRFVFLTSACLLLGCGPRSSSPPNTTGGDNVLQTSGGIATPPAKSGKRPKIAYVTNGIASFWMIAEKGAKDAAAELKCDVEVRMPPEGAADQKRMIEELITIGVDGMAVSPIDPDNQTDLLNMAAEHCTLITQDSDAPDSKRLAYIGMSNYDAGRMCGELIKEALPEGGSLVIFVGRLEQLNAKQRRQGLIDELMGRSHDPDRYDKPDDIIKNDKYTVLDTRTDNFDFGAAKAMAEDALVRYPDISCMVGLFAYNPPKILEALKGAEKLGQVIVIGFDEEAPTLQAIIDGHCHGTVVQNPYRYGFESVKMLQAIARGDKSAIPDSGFMDIPARKITKDNVVEFWDELKRLTE